jgi:hypothetical protein
MKLSARCSIPLALAAVVFLLIAFAAPLHAQEDQTMDIVTFYGFPDNSPPGTAIEFPQIHDQAGGTGTFDDPITFATDPRLFSPGQVIYVPFLQKYFIMEDLCTNSGPGDQGPGCVNDFDNGLAHIDLWTGGTADSDVQAQLDCEDSLTSNNVDIIVDPDDQQPVDTTPLFNADTGDCFQPGGSANAGIFNFIPKFKSARLMEQKVVTVHFRSAV